ncbi:hypothetical protein [Paraburkholderia lycopersici]|uniref:hypothetical protein n=1 Tax=Paraburkholderia lycopersici TaxID=416944 RepID=UPI0011613E7B|nr:hypothetical protein [Paraburkholderia lycopersici]
MQDQFMLSAWVRYGEHKTLKDCRLPGIYVLAHFKKPPVSTASVTSKEVIYIGETTGQDIAKRLYQFGRSAFKRLPAHSGGWRYSDEFLGSSEIDQPPNNLYVSIMGVNQSDTEQATVYIKYLERSAIWLFFQKNKSLPRCNAA